MADADIGALAPAARGRRTKAIARLREEEQKDTLSKVAAKSSLRTEWPEIAKVTKSN